MAESLSPHNIEGRDAQLPVTTAHGGTSSQGQRGRILLSMLGSDETVHHAAILCPDSYLEAMAMAVDAFHTEIASAGLDVKDLVLKLAMKRSDLSGKTAWSTIRPEQWAAIVRDRDEICMQDVGKATKFAGSSAEPAPGATVIFGKSNPKIPSLKTRVRVLLPRTYMEARVLARKMFYSQHGENYTDFFFQGMALSQFFYITPSQWLPIVSQMIREDPKFEILVRTGAGNVSDDF